MELLFPCLPSRSVARAGVFLLRALDEFDLVAFGGVDEREAAAAIGLHRRAVGVFEAVLDEVLAESFEAVHLEGEVGEVGLDLHGAAGGEAANLDGLLALRGFEEGEFGAARGFVAADFGEAEDVFVELDGAFQIVHAVAGVEEFVDLHKCGGE